jgi:predicted dienelactone hydrolase
MGGGAKAADVSPRRTFAVGHTIQRLNVPGTLGENRPLDVHLWYPARDLDDCDNTGNSDGNRDDQGCPATPSIYTSRLHGIPLLPQWDPLSWTIATSGSFENLPIDRGHRPFPVIIFSHGNQNNAIDYVYTLEALASFGYIVAAPDHLNNTQDDVRIDFINAQARTALGDPNFTLIPCFDGLHTPCEVSNRVKAENMGGDPLVSCPPVSLIRSTTASVLESFNDRVRDVSAIIDALPTWFGSRADTSRVGVMGHSRGTVTALAEAGGSACWNIKAEPRVKAVMGLSIGTQSVTLPVDLPNVTVPTLLVAGSLDKTGLPTVSELAFTKITSVDKNLVPIPNAEHRHFDSGFCAQTQSSGAIAQSAEVIVGDPNTTRAILELQTVTALVNTDLTPTSGVAMNFCGLETFTQPSDIRDLVSLLSVSSRNPTPFDFKSTSVPTDGLDSDQVKEQVVELAVGFFGRVL